MNKQRKCVGCGEIKDRESMIRLTKDFQTGHIILNPNSKTFGRSAYLCYNHDCIETALKKNKLNRALKSNEDLKGILDGQY
ncbi:MAG: YlxR family protein [bacterium]|nr:YlxR family protein [bacterium]